MSHFFLHSLVFRDCSVLSGIVRRSSGIPGHSSKGGTTRRKHHAFRRAGAIPSKSGQPCASTLGYIVWRPYPSNGGFLRAFFDAMDVSADAADGAERHCSLVGDALPRISDALPWTADRPRLLMSLKVSDSAPAAHACFIARSSSISCEDRFFSLVRIGYSTDSSLDSRSVFRLDNGAWRRSAKAAHLRCVWWLDELCAIESLHARFYRFEKVVASESATCLEPDCTVLRLRTD